MQGRFHNLKAIEKAMITIELRYNPKQSVQTRGYPKSLFQSIQTIKMQQTKRSTCIGIDVILKYKVKNIRY